MHQEHPADLPDSNQQSKTSSTRFNTPLPCFEGIVMWSILSLWISVIPVTPDSVSSSSTEPMHTILKDIALGQCDMCFMRHTSSMSSLAQSGSGVPQYRFREMFQSRALASQFPNLLSPTLCGTLEVESSQQAENYRKPGRNKPSCALVIRNQFVYNGTDPYKPHWDGAIKQRGSRSSGTGYQ